MHPVDRLFHSVGNWAAYQTTHKAAAERTVLANNITWHLTKKSRIISKWVKINRQAVWLCKWHCCHCEVTMHVCYSHEGVGLQINKERLNRGEHESWTAGVVNTFRQSMWFFPCCLNYEVQTTELIRMVAMNNGQRGAYRRGLQRR